MENPFLADDDDTYLTPFQGRVVICKCLEDAVLISFAERALNGEAGSPSQLANAIDALWRYGCDAAADALERIHIRLRAALYLTDSIGYERPI